MSTVHICLNDIFGVAVTCEVIFYPGDTPFLNGSVLTVSGAHSIRLDANGQGSATLQPGRYAVRFSGITSNTDTLLILVPTDTATHEFTDLICGGNWVLPMRDFLQKAENLGDIPDPAAAFNAIKQAATTSATGVIALATQAEVDAGTDDAKAVTPATLAHAARWSQAGGGAALKLIHVENDTARFALTRSAVNPFDLVETLDNHEVYQVLNLAALTNEWGYVNVGTRALPPSNDPLNEGLLAYWKLDEESGVRVDASGNGHDLSDTNQVGSAEGFGGELAALFDGNNYLQASEPIIESEADFTIAAWVRPTDPGRWSAVASTYPLAIAFAITPDGQLHLTVGFGSDFDGAYVENDVWSFVVARRSGSDLNLFLNAQESASGTAAPGEPANFTISGNTSGDARFVGLIARMGVWNRALTNYEIGQLYNEGNGLNPPF